MPSPLNLPGNNERHRRRAARVSLLLKGLAAICALGATLALSGCDKTGNVILNTPILTDEEGIWTGGFLALGGGGGTITLGFIQGGDLIALEGDPSNPCHFYAGDYNAQLTGTVTRYAGTATDSNGLTPSNACPNGSAGDGRIDVPTALNPNPVDMEISMFRTLNVQVGDTRHLMVLTPITDLYERLATPELITGTWNYDLPGNPPYNLPLTATPNGDGTLTMTGTDTLGCSYSGTITILDPNHNLYRIENMTLIETAGIQPGTGCVGYQTTGNERYAGFAAFLDDTAATNNVLAIMVASPTHAFYILTSRGS